MGHPSEWPVVDLTVRAEDYNGVQTPALNVGPGPHLVRFEPQDHELVENTAAEVLTALVPPELEKQPHFRAGSGIDVAVTTRIVPFREEDSDHYISVLQRHTPLDLRGLLEWLVYTARFGVGFAANAGQVLKLLLLAVSDMLERAAPRYVHIPDSEVDDLDDERRFYEIVAEAISRLNGRVFDTYVTQGDEEEQRHQAEVAVNRYRVTPDDLDEIRERASSEEVTSSIWTPAAEEDPRSDAPDPGVPTLIVPPSHWSPSVREDCPAIVLQPPFARLDHATIEATGASKLESWISFFEPDTELPILRDVSAHLYNDRVRLEFDTQPKTVLDFLSPPGSRNDWLLPCFVSTDIRLAWLPPHFDMKTRDDPDLSKFETEADLAVLRGEILAGRIPLERHTPSPFVEKDEPNLDDDKQ